MTELLEGRVLLASIYVDGDAGLATHNGASWGTAYQDVQAALAAAQSGDQILVAGGTYKPTTTTNRNVSFQLKNGVSLQGGYAGYGAATPNARDVTLYPTILSGDIGTPGSNADNSNHVVVGSSGITSSAVVDGFTVTAGNAAGGPSYDGGGISLSSASPTIRNCLIIGNFAGDGGGMMNVNHSFPTIVNCVFTANSAGYGGGMMNSSSSSPTVTNCTFSGNFATSGGGGMCNINSSSPTLSDCTFSGNSGTGSKSYGGGMYNDASSPALSNCTFSGNRVTGSYSYAIDGYGGGMYNGHSSSPVLSNCTFSGNSATGATGGVGGGMCNDSSSPTLTDCTFSGNSVTGSGYSSGGGMCNNISSSPRLTNCTFSGNSAMGATTYGGGMSNNDSSPTLKDCTLNGNSAQGSDGYGGGIYNNGSATTLTNCTFSENSAASAGGGLYNNFASPTLTDCRFEGNSVTGYYPYSDSRSYAYGGGMSSDNHSSPALTNCTFSGNSVKGTYSYGGGMCNGSSPTLTNCTFSGNSAAGNSSYGGGIYNFSSGSLTLTNCIVWGNTAIDGPQIHQDSGGTTTASYSDIQGGGFAGTGNLDFAPRFIRNPSPGPDGVWGTADDDYGDLRLRHTSPVIDGGNNAAANLGGIASDLAGQPRFVDAPEVADTGSGTAPIVDMGAYEFSRLTSVDQPPTDVALSSSGVAENQPAGTVVGVLSTPDADSEDTFTYSLVSGTGSADNAQFTVAGNTLKTARLFDYEGESSYLIRVRTTDAGGLWFEKAFTIGVANVNEAPTDVALSASSVAENQPAGTVVGNLSTTDADAGDAFTYSLVAGAGSDDNAGFAISGNQLTTGAVLDYETKSSYSIRVRVTDQGGLWVEKVFAIGAADINEASTSLGISGKRIAENLPAGTVVGGFSTVDPDMGDTFRYSLAEGGVDNAAFKITADGRLKTKRSFDYETKSSYRIRVRSTDQGGLFCEKAITIKVTDVNERPTDVVVSSYTVREHLPVFSLVGQLTGTDPDAGKTLTYALVNGAGSRDNGRFWILDGKLRTASVFDYATKSVYKIRVRVTDQDGLWYEKAMVVGVTR